MTKLRIEIHYEQHPDDPIRCRRVTYGIAHWVLPDESAAEQFAAGLQVGLEMLGVLASTDDDSRNIVSF